jgi:hypothetical protein
MSSRVWWWAWVRVLVDRVIYLLAGMTAIALNGIDERIGLVFLVIVLARVELECWRAADKEEREHGSV